MEAPRGDCALGLNRTLSPCEQYQARARPRRNGTVAATKNAPRGSYADHIFPLKTNRKSTEPFETIETHGRR